MSYLAAKQFVLGLALRSHWLTLAGCVHTDWSRLSSSWWWPWLAVAVRTVDISRIYHTL